MKATDNVLDATSKVQAATRANFNALVLASAGPVVVDFWAPWCVHCRKLAPTYDSLSAEMGKDITFVTVNVDDERELQGKYGISSLPTLKFFCSGREVGEVVGAMPKERLAATLKGMLRDHKECLAQSSQAQAG